MALFDPQALNPGVTRREVFAWACYDFANSGYTTVVLTAVFSAYFVSSIAADLSHPTTVWAWVLAVSNALVMVVMPLIGAYADLRARKKWLLIWSTAGCVATTALLALAGHGDVALASAATIASNFFYTVGVALIAAFLPELARPEALGRVSGWGWSFGYFGGMLTLGICIAYVLWAGSQGLSADHYVPVTMIIVAVTFALAAWPTLAVLKEQTQSVTGYTRESWQRLWQTLRQTRSYRDFAMLLACGALYQAGVAVVIALAAIYAKEVMHFGMVQTMILIFAVNITAAIGAFLFGYVQDRLGHRGALALTLVAWLAMTWIAAATTSVAMFWVAANLAGLAMGSSQSAGRAMAGALAPEKRRAEFYGLWILATQLASVIGPLTYGAVMIATGNNHRVSILATGTFFLAGLLLVATIDMRRGQQVAAAAS
jgi:MFS transporter, UMF1 family